MPKNNGKARRAWRKARAEEGAKFHRIWDEKVHPAAAKYARENGTNLAQGFIYAANNVPEWIDYDDRPTRVQHKPDTMRIEARLTCRECGETFVIPGVGQDAAIGCTTDCPRCDALLMIEADGVARNFHKVLHERDPRWPADGSNTGYIELQDRRMWDES